MKPSLWIVLWVLYAGAIAFCSHLPYRSQAGFAPFPGFDKFLHAAEFALFFFLARKALKERSGWAFLLTVLFAASDEFHQSFVASRDASFLDFMADGLGAAIGFFALTRIQILWRIRRQRILGDSTSKGDE